MTIWPPKVKKTPQNSLGSEKMWFNILKSDERRAAYRFFRNSVIHQGELIPPKLIPTEIVGEGELRLYSFKTYNGHFEFEAEYDKVGLSQFYLSDGPPNADSHIDYINGMFYEEYPEIYTALKKFFTENAPKMDFAAPTPEKIFARWSSPNGIPRHYRNLRYRMGVGETPGVRILNIHRSAKYFLSKEVTAARDYTENNSAIMRIIHRIQTEGAAITPDEFYNDFMRIWGQKDNAEINNNRLEDIWLDIFYKLHQQRFIEAEPQILNAYDNMKRNNEGGGFDDLADLFS